jgi:Flp pilus assembly protein TadG
LTVKHRLIACDSGVTTVEMAIVLTVFLGLLLGIVNFGLVIWTQSSMHYAVETAARCAAVNATTCGSATAIQNYALSQYFGQSLGGTNPFTYSATGCGHTVSGAYTYSLLLPLFPTYSLSLSASACFP